MSGYLDQILAWKSRVEDRLADRLPTADAEPIGVHVAMRNAALGEAKRLRPLIAMAVSELAGNPPEHVLDAACAIELVHTASLILDDLPSMDDAPTRRGRPSAHAEFGEATAILAAMGLLSLAYDMAARNALECGAPHFAGPVVSALSQAIGANGHPGLIGGQYTDLRLDGGPKSLEELEATYRAKAGALFLLCVEVPSRLLDIPKWEASLLEAFALAFGTAFQISDDLADPEEDGDRTTILSFLSVEDARARREVLIRQALSSLEPLGSRADLLRGLTEYVTIRNT